MQFRVFQYLLPTDTELSDLNLFLASNRIATVQQKIVNQVGRAMLVFVVEFISGAAPATGNKRGSKPDYRELLTSAQFSVFSQLRDLRKLFAKEEGVPVYAIFTNAQLAQIVQEKMTTPTDFQRIEGLGKGRLEKYADRLSALTLHAFDPAVVTVEADKGADRS